MKYSKWIGTTACVLLIVSCFLPWTYHADLNKTFTGFFSEKNMYGKPGKFLTLFAVLSAILILLPKIWAKRTHLFLAALSFGYAIRTFIVFTSCYNTYCPEKKIGVWLMLFTSLTILVVAVFPDMKLNDKNK